MIPCARDKPATSYDTASADTNWKRNPIPQVAPPDITETCTHRSHDYLAYLSVLVSIFLPTCSSTLSILVGIAIFAVATSIYMPHFPRQGSNFVTE